MRFGALLEVDHYAILGVPPAASREQIRRAYRRLVSISHPDLNPSGDTRAERRMAEINVAAGVLLDPAKRAAYDDVRAGRRPPVARRRRRPSTGPSPGPDWEARARATRLDARDQAVLGRLRSRPSRAFHDFDAWRSTWSPEFRMMFLVASMALAIGLIRVARPSSLPSPFEEARPASGVRASSART